MGMIGQPEPAAEDKRGRPSATIGFLTHYFGRDHISLSLWQGVTEQARAENVNLICFPGNAPRSTTGYDAQANIIYNLVDRRHVDGLLVWGSGMLGATDMANVQFLFDSLRGFPMINIGLSLDGIPALLIDNYRGMREACDHLIERHDCRRIGFFRGPAGHEEAELRFTAFRDSLRDHGLAFDPRLVIQGNFLRADARECVRAFLAQCDKPPDSLVAVNDLTALGIIDVLNERGVAIPDDIKVVGFDDLEEVQYQRVPLTTVRQPFFELGKTAVKNLLSVMRGEAVPPVTHFPARLVIRQSCGCLSPLLSQALVDPSLPPEESPLSADTAKEIILPSLIRETAAFLVEDPGLMRSLENLTQSAVADLSSGSNSFTSAFRREMAAADRYDDIDFFHSVVSALRRALLPFTSRDRLLLLRAENMWQEARIVVGDFGRRLAVLAGYRKNMQNEILYDVNRILIGSFDLDGFLDSLAAALPRLGFSCCFLSLYEEKKNFAFSRLHLASVDGRRIDIDRDGIRFPTLELAPPGFLPVDRWSHFIIQPLYFETEQLGFVVIEEGSLPGVANEILRAQLSGAVKGALLFREKENLLAALKQRAEELQERTIDLARANADLEQFAVIASHDLQAPLRKISLFADRLKKHDADFDPAARRDYLDRMQVACRHMKTLIADLLTYSRLSSRIPHFTRVDLSEVARQAVRDLGSIISDSGAVISIDMLPSLRAEAQHIRLLFYHLIANAVKFQPAGRTPSVRISCRTPSPNDDHAIEIVVEDNGIGIDEKYFDRIFGVFQRLHTTREYEGTGMGLALCKKIINRHRGDIRVESTVGEGTRFIVTLPTAAETE